MTISLYSETKRPTVTTHPPTTIVGSDMAMLSAPSMIFSKQKQSTVTATKSWHEIRNSMMMHCQIDQELSVVDGRGPFSAFKFARNRGWSASKSI